MKREEGRKKMFCVHDVWDPFVRDVFLKATIVQPNSLLLFSVTFSQLLSHSPSPQQLLQKLQPNQTHPKSLGVLLHARLRNSIGRRRTLQFSEHKKQLIMKKNNG
jgi:hypothetical protein